MHRVGVPFGGPALKFSELEKIPYENYETIFMPRNLKSFQTKIPNLQSSVEYLFFYSVKP
jgi:hypothetical protein